MERSSELFEAFLKCPTKCWLQSRGEACEGNAYAQWVKGQNESYRAEEMRRLQATVPEGDRVVAPATENLKGAKWRLAVDVVVQAPAPASSSSVSLPERTAGGIPGLGQPEDEKPALRPQPDPWMLASRLHAVERVAPEGRGKPTQFIPIRFIYRNKLTRDDRLLVAFDALVLSESLGRDTSLAKISHGDDHATLMVKTAGLLGEVRKLAVKMAEMLASDSPPDIVLNRHCGECEFREQCRQKAFEKDDLSLLANMTAKERKKFRNKGIFTVTQLSYTFRPRRRPKRMRAKRDKYYHSLKALAIREKKVHIVGNPELKIEGTLVYLDVEGLPDRDFYYLVGIRVGNGESAVQHSFWADTVADEGRLWRQFLAILETAENPVVLHYGSFEKTFWRRMCQRHGEPPVGSKPAKAIDSAINLVSFAYAQIYFPTYSNQLKEIASWCGFSWSDPSLLGPNSIALRSDWEASGNPVAKQHLINYNAEDCKALEIVTRFACGVCRCESPGTNRPNSNVVVVDNLKPLKRFILINKDGAALPEFKEINKAAYWDYQRQRVYVRSSKIIKKASQGMHKRKAKCLPDQGTIYHAVPSACPRCGGVDLDVKDASSFLTLDVKLMRRGVKGLVRRVVWPQVYCKHCQQLVPPPGTPLFRIRKYGLRLRAYAISQLLELRISGAKVARSLNQIFHYGLTGSTISAFKSDFAKMYGDTVRKLTDRMVMGSLVQVDETQGRTVGKSGYVWVLSSLEEVVYLYNDSREGGMIWSLLDEFRGVLVSDFYAVYDSLECPQQKCLIHLMRDINDDLHKYPFDEGLREIAQAFAGLLKPMIETIDKHGLKKHFLSKHVVAVEEFYSWIAEAHFASEVGAGYVKRFLKYRDKLFTFLKYNDVPWNNNNAENAIRAFGELRDIIKGVTTEKGLRDYLVLLSICETCKRRGISFLNFLCSGETDLEQFARAKSIRSKGVTGPRKLETTTSSPTEPVQHATKAIPRSSVSQLTSWEQWHSEHERQLQENELNAWSRFTCPGRFPWPGNVGPLVPLERFDGMPIGGALASLPAMVESGFGTAEQLFPMNVEAPMQEMAMLLIALSSVSRTPSIDALQRLVPASWKNILFSKRLPDNRSATELIKLICSAPHNIALWKAHCVDRFRANLARLDGLLSVNGCRRLYADGKRTSRGTESARRMLMARCIVEPWAQVIKGRPFFLFCGDLSRDRRSWLNELILTSWQGVLGELRTGKMQAASLNQARITVIFSAGGFYPAFFGKLFKMGHHVLSYLLSSQPPWPNSEFRFHDVNLLSGKTVRLQIAERVLPLAGKVCFRELRCLTTDSQQISVISSDRELYLQALAGSLIVRLSEVRVLDYLRIHSALDGLCEGILESSQAKAKPGNKAVTPRSFRGPHYAIKEFLNANRLISFRAEKMLALIICERISEYDKAVLMVRNLWNSPADLVPNPKHETLTVRLHPQTLDGCEEALHHLCSELNPTEPIFPATDLRLVYEVGSPA